MGPGNWVDLNLPSALSEVRSFAVHYNPVARTEKLYVGLGTNAVSGAVYSGTYGPLSSGSIIQWDSEPVVSDLPDRVMSMVDCGGVLFAAAKPSIYWLDDQTNQFEILYTYPLLNKYDESKFTSGFRALTCIDDPTQSGKKELLTGFESTEGAILLVDPSTGAVQLQLDTRQFLQEQWGKYFASSVVDIIPGYTNMPTVSTEVGKNWLIGLQA